MAGPTAIVTPAAPTAVVEVAKVFAVAKVTPMVPVRWLDGQQMVTSCELASVVWVVKATVTDLPIAKGMRSAVAMVKVTQETAPPSATVAAVAGKSVVVDIVTPQVVAAMGPPMVAPVSARARVQVSAKSRMRRRNITHGVADSSKLAASTQELEGVWVFQLKGIPKDITQACLLPK